MRDVALTIILLAIIPLVFLRPHVGVLAWAWVSLMNPHKEVYSFLAGANLNFFIACLTIVALIFSRERHLPKLNQTLIVMMFLAAWTTITTYAALNYDVAYDYWLRTIKTFGFLLIMVMIIDRASRLHSLILIIVVSIGYWGVLTAVRTVASLGHSVLAGAPDTMIGDNNALALALVMVLPLVEYCRYVSSSALVRNACSATLICFVVAILGTHSRGGLIALAVVLIALWWKSKSRLLAAGIIGISIVSIVLLPQQWSEKMSTIQTYQEVQTFQERVWTWTTAIRIGLDRPIIGAGYKAMEDPATYQHYRAEGDTIRSKAVHDAYLQVLAEHGFVGLALFAFMFFLSFRNCRWVVKRCSNTPDLYWLRYLASMLEIGLIGYAVGAIALAVAYYDLFLMMIALSSIMRDYAQHELKDREDTGKRCAEWADNYYGGALSKTKPLESVKNILSRRLSYRSGLSAIYGAFVPDDGAARSSCKTTYRQTPIASARD